MFFNQQVGACSSRWPDLIRGGGVAAVRCSLFAPDSVFSAATVTTVPVYVCLLGCAGPRVVSALLPMWKEVFQMQDCNFSRCKNTGCHKNTLQGAHAAGVVGSQ